MVLCSSLLSPFKLLLKFHLFLNLFRIIDIAWHVIIHHFFLLAVDTYTDTHTIL